MDDTTRRQITQYVKPLAAGLDGVTYSGDVERVIACSERIAGARTDLDRDLLYLLAVFSGQGKWVATMGHGSRTEIFLASLGIPARSIRSLLRGLARLAESPATPEEEIVHDAVCLDQMGAHGIARQVLEGYRERMDFGEMAASIEDAARRQLKTAAAEALAGRLRETMLDFARRLREELE